MMILDLIKLLVNLKKIKISNSIEIISSFEKNYEMSFFIKLRQRVINVFPFLLTHDFNSTNKPIN